MDIDAKCTPLQAWSITSLGAVQSLGAKTARLSACSPPRPRAPRPVCQGSQCLLDSGRENEAVAPQMGIGRGDEDMCPGQAQTLRIGMRGHERSDRVFQRLDVAAVGFQVDLACLKARGQLFQGEIHKRARQVRGEAG